MGELLEGLKAINVTLFAADSSCLEGMATYLVRNGISRMHFLFAAILHLLAQKQSLSLSWPNNKP